MAVAGIDGVKYRWRTPRDEHRHELSALAARFNISMPVVQTLITRNYTTPERIEQFLFSDVARDVAHPSLLKDANKAVDRLIKAIEQHEKILICGDYDVDGITSASLMLMCLLPLGAQVNFFLPHRTRDGYGLATKTVERAARNGYTVLITVDNGTTAFEPATKAKELGIDLIITDHHRPHGQVPEAFAFVNPHQSDCPYPYKYFAGVGVSFKLMALLYERLGLTLPDAVYELLMMGTIADVVPLTHENRYWVRHGLQRARHYESTGLSVLKQHARITKPFLSSTDIGFFIAPQINALGRLDDAREGVSFLMSTDRADVERIGATLAALNESRKSVERSILHDIETSLKGRDMVRERVVIASNNNWPSGVIGLVASRLVGQFNRPTFLFHLTAEGVARGSCRSIPAFNLFNALTEVSDLLLTFGGHSAAAGLSLPVHKLPEFKERMEAIVDAQLTADDLLPTVQLDAELPLREVSTKLAHDLQYLEPFGCENPTPLFHVKNVAIMGEPQLLKDVHVKCLVFAEGIMKPIIFFNRPDLFKLMRENSQGTYDLAAHVTENHWNNDVKIELQGIDMAVKP